MNIDSIVPRSWPDNIYPDNWWPDNRGPTVTDYDGELQLRLHSTLQYDYSGRQKWFTERLSMPALLQMIAIAL